MRAFVGGVRIVVIAVVLVGGWIATTLAGVGCTEGDNNSDACDRLISTPALIASAIWPAALIGVSSVVVGSRNRWFWLVALVLVGASVYYGLLLAAVSGNLDS